MALDITKEIYKIMNYTLIRGDIFDDKYRKANICICQQCNCITLRPHKLSADMVLKFGSYTNSYGRRTPRNKMSNCNIASVDTRPKPGTIEFCKGVPCVANLFGQFFFGKPSDTKQCYFDNSSDDHMEMGIRNDKSSNREAYFKSCLDRLHYDLVNIHTDIDTVIFPYEIGCGAACGNWKIYENFINQFAGKLKNEKKYTKIVYNLEKMKDRKQFFSFYSLDFKP